MEQFTNGKQACKNFEILYGKKTYSQYKRYDNLIRQFKKRFAVKSCNLASASGRVEFVGNHTDHNGGKVIGCCVNLDIVAAFLPNNSNVVRIVSSQYAPIEFCVADAEKIQGGSAGMAKGVVAYLKKNGYKVGGFDACFHSTVPSGAGISSSAAFEVLAGVIISHCYNNGTIKPDELARAGQYAENVYFNKPSGLLDQSVVAFGGIVELDFKKGVVCHSLDTTFDKVNLALVNTGKSHANLTNMYASIPQEMRQVAAYFGKERLVEVDAKQLESEFDSVRQNVGARPAYRAKHFFEENVRVDEMVVALEQCDVNKVISLVNASGDSSMNQLQNCAVDDHDTAISDAVNFARSQALCGARVHGGGFAGTVLCVAPTSENEKLLKQLVGKYGKKNVLPLKIRSVGAMVL